MRTYSLNEMRTDCSNFFSSGIPDTDPYREFLFYLYITGLRFNEMQNCRNWDYSHESGIIVPLSKGSANRILDNTLLPPAAIQSTFASFEYFYYVNNSTASNLFNKYYAHRLFLSTGKPITTYVFRHLYIKNLASEGKTAQQIATIMGEVNANNIAGYIDSVFETP